MNVEVFTGDADTLGDRISELISLGNVILHVQKTRGEVRYVIVYST